MATNSPNMGLKIWNHTLDPYNSSELADNFARLDQHDHANGRGVQIPAAGIADGSITQAKIATDVSLPTATIPDGSIATVKYAAGSVGTAALATGAVTNSTIASGAVNSASIQDGSIVADDVASAELNRLGLSSSAVVRRGKSIIATTESRANTAYGTLTTPDRVTGVVLPTDGLIFIAFQALWLATGSPSSGQARITLNGIAIKRGGDGATTPDIETGVMAGSTNFGHLSTNNGGIAGGANINTNGVQVTTGQVVSQPGSSGSGDSGGAGFFPVFAAAGTYTVAVEFKAPFGTVQVKNRKLWVWTMGF